MGRKKGGPPPEARSGGRRWCHVTVELVIAAVPSSRPSVVLVCDGADAGAAVASLEECGFVVVAAAAGEPVAAGGATVLVLALGAGAEARVRAVGEAVRRQPGVPVVTTMPAVATGVQLRKALHAGAAGVVLDDRVATTLGPTAQAVAVGQLAMPPALARRVAPRVLSHREKEILELVAIGLTNRQIADRLFVAESTVKSHLSSSLHKLDVRSRAEAVALILDPEQGYVARKIEPLHHVE
jgi:DNA-binding NarL/FixJ family response regulator